MKVSVNWLRELVDINLSVEELAHTLTMAGLEVEEITPVATFSGIVVAEVKSTAQHPNADKLKVCEVDAGTGQHLQIVCGAPNVAPGMRVPCALVGAMLPGLEIKATKLRGVDSNGMLCSARELGLSDDHGGLLPLAADAPIGVDVRKVLDMDDVMLTLKMTPNRGDCLSMIGIARDLAAVTGATLRIPTIPPNTSTGADSRRIHISAPDACGHYLGRVITGINARAATPVWMKNRLERAGFRSISPLVDITNYLTLERGRPMHAFDNDKLNGSIEVRFPKVGETLKLLNEQDVSLTADMLLIAVESTPLALGGVMGGFDSMCTDTTTNVFFEAAYFNPVVIQGKTRVLGINSDAAFRFERGVDPDSARDGIEYATALTLAICGTAETKTGPITEALGTRPTRAQIIVSPARVNAKIGVTIGRDRMVSLLRSLSCVVEADGNDENATLHVTSPSYRFDLSTEEDFTEEIARLYGYDNVPAHAPFACVGMLPHPETKRPKHALRHLLAAMGFQEVINYSFVPRAWEANYAGNAAPIALANPIASHMEVMRTSLIGGLISTLAYNLNQGETQVRLFEIGRCFLRNEADVAAQPEKVAGLAYGPRAPEQWGEGGQKGAMADFFHLKGDVERLMGNDTGVRFVRLSDHPALHPGRAATILKAGVSVGFIGELHPQWQQAEDFTQAPIVFELSLDALQHVPVAHFSAFSRQQAVRRDIAFVMPDTVELQSISDSIEALKNVRIIEFVPFDIFRGQSVGHGQKSVAFRVVMQDTHSTLTDLDAENIVAEIVNVVSDKFGATLRK